jgi:hypothetical protein
MQYPRSNLGQRLQHKPALVHRRVRNFQARFIDHTISKQQDIDVNDARPFVPNPPAAHPLFDRKSEGQQVARRLGGFQRNRAVEKPRLIMEIYRLGFVKAGRCGHGSRLCQTFEGITKIGYAIAHVRSQRQVDEFRQNQGHGRERPFYANLGVHRLPFRSTRVTQTREALRGSGSWRYLGHFLPPRERGYYRGSQ